MSCSSCGGSNSYAFWISIWILILFLFIVAIACRSIILIFLILIIALIIGVSQAMYSNVSKCGCKKNVEISFAEGQSEKEDIMPNIGLKEAHISKKARMEYGSELYYPKNTDLGAVKCATRNVDSGDQEDESNEQGWVTGYQGPEPWIDAEGALEKLAVDAMQEAESQTEDQILPKHCNEEPLPCNMRLAWQPSFIGCPSTFIEAPSCKIYERDDRLWNRRLGDVIQERAVQSGEIWDPYKHFTQGRTLPNF